MTRADWRPNRNDGGTRFTAKAYVSCGWELAGSDLFKEATHGME